MKKGIIFGIFFVAGIATGIATDKVIEVIKNKKEKEDEPIDRPELLYFENHPKQEKTEDQSDPIEPMDIKEMVDTTVEQLKETVENLGYTEKPTKIEIISEKEFNDLTDGFLIVDEPYHYFPDTDELTNAEGELLEPMGYYIGDRFDKVHFQTNDWEDIRIKNYALNEKFKILKEELPREEYFSY